MGTLFEQQARDRCPIKSTDIDRVFFEIKEAMQRCEAPLNEGLTFSEALSIYKMLSYDRRTDIILDDMDANDEKMAGFGEIARKFVDLCEEIHRR